MAVDSLNAQIGWIAGDIYVDTEERGLVNVAVGTEFEEDENSQFVMTPEQARKLADVLKIAADLSEVKD